LLCITQALAFTLYLLDRIIRFGRSSSIVEVREFSGIGIASPSVRARLTYACRVRRHHT
jgi:hypothetical protein